MDNGVNKNNNDFVETPKEEIKAAKVYKLSPENAPKEIPKTEEKPWEKKKEKPSEEEQPKEVEQPKVIYKQKKHSILTFFLLVIVILMAAYIGYSYYNYNLTINRYNSLYSPVSTTGNEKNLDINSPFVQNLYNNVKTNIREDIAESELNMSMRLYLAYRNIPHTKIYDSNCDGFDNSAMIPYTCSDSIIPKAFKKEDLLIEYQKLFGENLDFSYQNIQIGKNCIGGYQYIPSRNEYVQGYCTSNITTTAKVTKKLLSATSKESTITLKEEVKYVSSEGQFLPEYLKSGTYNYIFKLDRNYNYIYVNKYLE